MTELIRDLIEARRAAEESAAGTEEHDRAMRWKVEAGSALLNALGARRFRPTMPRSRQPLPLFPELRRVHRPEVA